MPEVLDVLSRRKQVVQGDEVVKRHLTGSVSMPKHIEQLGNNLFGCVAWQESRLHLGLSQVSSTSTYLSHCLLLLVAYDLRVDLLQLWELRSEDCSDFIGRHNLERLCETHFFLNY